MAFSFGRGRQMPLAVGSGQLSRDWQAADFADQAFQALP